MTRQGSKRAPVGVCDLCGAAIPRRAWYTRRGTPRLYCSRECRNTANSRDGAAIRSAKAKARVARGEWVNPLEFESPELRREHARRAGLASGHRPDWVNPALSDEARAKLSRPRVHGDNPVLHRALEKRTQGASMADLSEEEAEAYRAYSRALRAAKDLDTERAKSRAWYRKRQARKRRADLGNSGDSRDSE